MEKRSYSRSDWLSGQTCSAIILGISFFLFGLAGVLTAGHMDITECVLLKSWLNEAIRAVGNEAGRLPFVELFLYRLQMAVPVLILGTSPLGMIGLPLMFGWLGFRSACAGACLFRVYGVSALYPAAALFGVFCMAWVPLLLMTGSRALQAAWNRWLRGGQEGDKPPERSVWPWLTACVVLFLLCVLFEYFAAPALLRAAAQVIL